MNILDIAERNQKYENILKDKNFIKNKTEDVLKSLKGFRVMKLMYNCINGLIKFNNVLKQTIKNFYEMKKHLIVNERTSEKVIKRLKTIENILNKHNSSLSVLNHEL
ncbi:hypothetical protein CDIK_0772 [Cucumispora dikerogammari]|nr:hypothetical protein CDIK_0772 [Cucumispora dikerogammari]